MASQKQIAANRRNSLKSTGPTSAAGKAASSMNALKTGLRATSLIIPGESAAELQQLINEYYVAYHPSTPEARALVDDLIRSEWTLRRLDTSEASLWNYRHDDSIHPVAKGHRQGRVVYHNAATLEAIQRRIDSTRRGRDRALQQLRGLAAKPLSMPAPLPTPTPIDSITSAPIGFVRSSAPDPPRPFPAAPNPAEDANSAGLRPSSTVG
jgi:hypothetical protein